LGGYRDRHGISGSELAEVVQMRWVGQAIFTLRFGAGSESKPCL
jgi:hypothetical protein